MTQNENNQAYRENGQAYRDNGQVYRDNQQLHQEYRGTKENMSSRDFLMGTLIGGIIGAATALFMAPKSGRELRTDLNTQTTKVLDKTEKMRQTAMEKGTQFAGAAKERTSSVTGAVTSTSQNLMNKVKSMTGKETGSEGGSSSEKHGLTNSADSIKPVVPTDYDDTTTSGIEDLGDSPDSLTTADLTTGAADLTTGTSAGLTDDTDLAGGADVTGITGKGDSDKNSNSYTSTGTGNKNSSNKK
ncbi:YtxH domain-containing protein [Peribacillus sp. SCS-37]|uniref:YtxH domain-containing protein n=1 Tax=Paraperibacillus esterisolvens TaxID=3115296 RepID=UPI0039061D00